MKIVNENFNTLQWREFFQAEFVFLNLIFKFMFYLRLKIVIEICGYSYQ